MRVSQVVPVLVCVRLRDQTDNFRQTAQFSLTPNLFFAVVIFKIRMDLRFISRFHDTFHVHLFFTTFV